MEAEWNGMEWNGVEWSGVEPETERWRRLNTACLNTYGGVGDGCAWRAWNRRHRL